MINIIKKVKNPIQYLGLDLNVPKKNWDKTNVKFLLAFPDLYEIGASNLGIQILYNIINSFDDYLCDRIFAPDIDFKNLIERNEILYTSLDFKKKPILFDIIGFSLQYELSYTTVLSMLKLMEIPLKTSERINNKNVPIICAGGPCSFNPLPLSPFIDFFLIGDGEEAVIKKCEIISEMKGMSKIDILKELSKIEGCYVPIFSENKIIKSILSNLEYKYMPEKPIVPLAKTVHDRLNIEISRGCLRGCRFCQAGIIYRPLREKNINDINKYINIAKTNTGYEEISLLSLSIGDYSELENLLDIINENEISISLPSIRVDRINEKILNILSKREKTSFTIAPEAATERLRKIINKDLKQEDIFNTVNLLFSNGWHLIKLYFMIGLPLEELDDIKEIVSLSKKLIKIGKKYSRKNKLNVSISTFVPKPHTPFQWFGQNNFKEIKEKLNYIKNNLKDRNISLKWHKPEMSLIEAVLSRGDKKIANLLLKVFENGGYLESWSDKFNFKLWENAAEETMINLFDLATTEYSINNNLPWDFIDTGVKKDFLIQEYRNAINNIETTDCRIAGCNKCGVCSLSKNKFAKHSKLNLNVKTENQKKNEYKAFTYRYSKLKYASLIGQRDMTKLLIRALIRTGIKLKHTEGFHPKVKISFSPPPPFGVESREEFFTIYIANSYSPDILDKINNFLPPGIKVNKFFETDINLTKDLISSLYSIKHPELDAIEIFKKLEHELILEKYLDEGKCFVEIGYKDMKHINIIKLLKSFFKNIDWDIGKVVREKLNYKRLAKN